MKKLVMKLKEVEEVGYGVNYRVVMKLVGKWLLRLM